MAGIFDRVREGQGLVHLLDAVFVFYHRGAYNKQTLAAALGNELSQNGYPELSSADLTDLNAIAVALDGSGSASNKLSYLNAIRANTMAAEYGAVNEAAFRSNLGID